MKANHTPLETDMLIHTMVEIWAVILGIIIFVPMIYAIARGLT